MGLSLAPSLSFSFLSQLTNTETEPDWLNLDPVYISCPIWSCLGVLLVLHRDSEESSLGRPVLLNVHMNHMVLLFKYKFWLSLRWGLRFWVFNKPSDDTAAAGRWIACKSNRRWDGVILNAVRPYFFCAKCSTYLFMPLLLDAHYPLSWSEAHSGMIVLSKKTLMSYKYPLLTFF